MSDPSPRMVGLKQALEAFFQLPSEALVHWDRDIGEMPANLKGGWFTSNMEPTFVLGSPNDGNEEYIEWIADPIPHWRRCKVGASWTQGFTYPHIPLSYLHDD